MKRSLLVAIVSLSCTGARDPVVANPAGAPATTATIVASPLPPAPTGRLPRDVIPERYALELSIDPRKDRFSGVADVQVRIAKPVRHLFLHGRDLHVTKAAVRAENGTFAATWTAAHESGVAALSIDGEAAAGAATLHFEWDAPYNKTLRGLYRVDRGSESYAFTQFEAIDARRAFPCFDEPAFKTPFDVALVVPNGQVGIGNTAEKARKAGATTTRIELAPTLPLPTYLLAWAVGPLDVVAAPDVPPNEVRTRPLPLRGVAAKGRGKELAHALAHTGALVATLERWFGLEYPYDKLDVIAVPDRDGAMENAGAITFAEWLLLLDEKTAPLAQKRAFGGVMAHELAHQWFGDLVTMPWWDDIWLNEAFATFMGNRAHLLWDPTSKTDVSLVDRVQDAMGVDALVSARAIRQPILSEHDIANAFDAITYQKGAGVLAMFERWLGKEVFQKGIRAHLAKHPHGVATSDDLLAALGEAAQKDVATPFRTFLDQPGVPFVEVKPSCAAGKGTLALTQSRYLPLGSSGNGSQRWQVPICVRHPGGEHCTLLAEETGAIDLPTCPAWVLPNADAAGYYRWSLPSNDLATLFDKAWPKLGTRDRLAVVDALRAGFSRGTLHANDVFPRLSKLVDDPWPSLASSPMSFAGGAREWLFGEPLQAKVESWSRDLYAKVWKSVGLAPNKGEAPERTFFRSGLFSFLSFTARDPVVRKLAHEKGRAYLGFGGDGQLHPEVLDPNLLGTAVAVAAQEEGAAFFDALLAKLETTEDAVIRGRLIGALSSAIAPELAKRARELVFDSRLRLSEALSPLATQLSMNETRDAAWAFLRERFDDVLGRISARRAGHLPWMAARFCDAAHVTELETFFTPRITKLEGGPRNLSGALEAMRLCVARRKEQEPSVRAFFAKIP